MRRTLGQRSGAMERTHGGEHAQPCPVSEPPSLSLPSATRDVSWVSRQQREGVRQRRTLGSEHSWEGQQGSGREPQQQLQVPGDSPGCRAACPQDCPVLLSPWRGHRGAHVYAGQSSTSRTKHACLVLPLPGERVPHCSGAMSPEGTFPAPLAR